VKRSNRLYLNDILESIEKIMRYVDGLSLEDFMASDMIFDAVVRNLEIIGEASNHIAKSVQSASPKVPWRLMKDMRNVLSHEYFGIDVDIIWKTVTESLPLLVEPLNAAMDQAQNEESGLDDI
jgi:uncharacterized protein with HEPN domain